MEDEDLAVLTICLATFIISLAGYVSLNLERNPSIFDQRLMWGKIVERHSHQFPFQRHLRMRMESFNLLLSYIRDELEVDKEMADKRGGPILPELCLYCTLRWLAGGSYSDIYLFVGISTSSFYRICWKTIFAIVTCPELAIQFPQTLQECQVAAAGFESVSYGGAITNCIGVVDGFLLKIVTPPSGIVGNVRSYFSGHYQCYGVNVQAVSDHLSRFIYFAVAGPGVLGDNLAMKEVDLYDLIQKIPRTFCVIGDAAYSPTERIVPVYYGADKRRTKYDNFNYYASQCRIRIEMAFGLMTKKWGILWKPLHIKVNHVKTLALAISRLHNFTINERIRLNGTRDPASEQGVTGREEDVHVAATAAEVEATQANLPAFSELREMMVERVEALGLTRPGR